MSGEARASRCGLRRRGLAWPLPSLHRSCEARVADRKRALFAPLAGTVADRETWRFIESAGFASVAIERARVPLDIASPHSFGTAVA